jgi:hypothetical protein
LIVFAAACTPAGLVPAPASGPLPETPAVEFPAAVTQARQGRPDIDALLRTLTPRQKLGQLLMPWVVGSYAAFDDSALVRAAGWVDSLELGGIIIAGGSPTDIAVKLNWLPPYGQGGWKHLILPSIALGAFALASLTRLSRSSVLEVTRKDHTQFLRAKGVSSSRLVGHTLRNASLPIVTLAGILLGTLFSGAVIVETIFAWPGVGQMAIQGINSRDYNVVQGVVLVNTAIFVLLLFLVDISYGVLDPRVRSRTRGATASG